MSRINTNIASLVSQRVLAQNNNALGKSLERLSTGLRINRGKDDPAGLIASESLRSELRAANAAIANAERADQFLNTAEGGLQEVSSLLTELQGLVTASANAAGLSESERGANQLQIDSILQTVDRIAGATNFQGLRLLSGGFDYTVSGTPTGIEDLRIKGAKWEGDSMAVSVIVTASAQQAGLYLSMNGASLDLQTGSAFTLEITGSAGSRELTFASGTTMTSIADAINTLKDVTGVQAAVVASGTSNGIKLFSSGFGSAQFVTARVMDDGGIAGGQRGIYDLQAGDFDLINTTRREAFDSFTAQAGTRDSGQDIGVFINGARATTQGKAAWIDTDMLAAELKLTDMLAAELKLTTAQSQSLGLVGASSFYITGGGAEFMPAAKVDLSGRVSLGMRDVNSRRLGNTELGVLSELGSGRRFNAVTGDLSGGQKVIAEAITQVSDLRGRLGSFQKNVIGTTIRSMNIAIENTAAAESVIRDAEFASETAGLTRSQILVSASTNILGLANSAPQSVLQLLG